MVFSFQKNSSTDHVYLHSYKWPPTPIMQMISQEKVLVLCLG